MKKNLISINQNELKEFLGHIITNNRHLQENGKGPVSVEVIGESGIGKTSSIIQLANELDLSFVKLNLAQIEEIGDLVGFPIRQFEVTNGTDKKYVDENSLDEARSEGYKTTGHNRMSYCPPEWIANKENGGILLLDDWNRADQRFIQAVMELIDRQQYVSWSLPKDWHIILTANPDNGDYIVNTLDSAQKTRFISVQLKFDMDCWAKWEIGRAHV
jgi:MoxR-like ATPase